MLFQPAKKFVSYMYNTGILDLHDAFLQVILDQYHQLQYDYSFTSKLISFTGQPARLNYTFEPVFGWLIDRADMTENVSYIY